MAPINIRSMTPHDRKAVLAMMRRSFPVFEQLFFSLTESTLVAESEGRLLGAIVLKVFKLPDKTQGGVVNWIFSDPSARGLGVGQVLIEAGLAWLEEAGCTRVFAIVEGFNTSSSKLFATRGFSILPFREQRRRFGLFGLLQVWLASFHVTDVGHFLWGKPAAVLPDKPRQQFLWTLILNLLAAALVVWRWWGFRQPDLTALWALPAVTLMLIELRTIVMTLAARKQGVDLQFRMWESGFNLSLPLALLFGFYFPVPGGLYLKQPLWRYRDRIPEFGRIGLAGALPTLLLSWTLILLRYFIPSSPWVGTMFNAMFQGAYFFAIFDILLVFFPFVSFNGRRIWDWNKLTWLVCALAVVALFIVDRFI